MLLMTYNVHVRTSVMGVCVHDVTTYAPGDGDAHFRLGRVVLDGDDDLEERRGDDVDGGDGERGQDLDDEQQQTAVLNTRLLQQLRQTHERGVVNKLWNGAQ